MHKTVLDNDLRNMLTRYAEQYETASFIVGDPSWWMHQVEGDLNREATAFVASVLSYGSRSQFMPKIGWILERAKGDVDSWLRKGDYESDFMVGCGKSFYRLYSYDRMHGFFDAYRKLLEANGSLGCYVMKNAHDGLSAVEALCEYFSRCGVSVVVPKDATSACKRVCMFLRWMVRSGSPVDLGLWKDIVDRRTLIMPMDTHVVSQAMRLGLLQSRCASMNAARRLTDVMAEVFPEDPLRGDFALFGYGVMGEKEC